MNIGIVISNICAGAGTERAVTNLANGIAELTEHTVVIFSVYSSQNSSPYYALNPKVEVVHLGHEAKENALKRVGMYRRLRRELSRYCSEYDLSILMGTIHSYNCVISTIKDVAKIGCEHINYEACPKLFRGVRRVAYRRLDRVVLLTNEDRKKYAFLGPEKTAVIPNIRSFYPDTAAGLENKKIITVGRLQPQKGYDILLAFADRLKEALPDWKITIFGDGEMEESLKKTIREKALESFVAIHEPVKSIQEELLDSSLYLMTSRNEGLPMVLIEAQACGLPIVSFDCPEGPRDIIHDGEDGFLIPVGDIGLMVDKIIEIAKTPQMRTEMGKPARQNSGNYSSETIVREWTRLFDEAAGQG